MPEEAPRPGTACVVTECENPATVYVKVGEAGSLEGASSVPMCDLHAGHWREGATGASE